MVSKYIWDYFMLLLYENIFSKVAGYGDFSGYGLLSMYDYMFLIEKRCTVNTNDTVLNTQIFLNNHRHLKVPIWTPIVTNVDQ